MFQPVGYNPQCECLDFRLGLLWGSSVHHDPGKVRNFRNPAPVFLLFGFYLEGIRWSSTELTYYIALSVVLRKLLHSLADDFLDSGRAVADLGKTALPQRDHYLL